MRRFNSFIADLAESFTEDKIDVLVAGDSAFIEYGYNNKPEKLILPEPPEDLNEQTLRLYNGYVDHEVSHAEYTDIDARADYKSQFAESQIALFVGQIVEDCHIEQRRTKRWRGSAKNLIAVFEQKLWPQYSGELEPPETIKDEVNNFIVAAPTFLRAFYGVPGHDSYLESNKAYCPTVLKAIEQGIDCVTFKDSTEGCRHAAEISRILSDLYLSEPEEEQEAQLRCCQASLHAHQWGRECLPAQWRIHSRIAAKWP